MESGASHTIITTEFLEKMKIPFLDNDELVKATVYSGTVWYSIRKRIDEISCGNLVINDFKIDFGVIDPTDRVNGLIGLDFLIGVGSMIDLVDLKIYKKQ